jgi:hypothetical protein
MSDEHKKETIETLDHLKEGSTIALTADLANDNPNSICRIALAWISGDDVYSVAFYAKPDTDDFSASRKITAERVKDCECFADVWDHKVMPLFKTNVLSAYKAESLFQAIKESYEASGRPFVNLQFFVRDLYVMSQVYILDLGNYSLSSIARRMNISVDLDSAISRAMVCVTAVDWLDVAYPNNNYGTPLGIIIASPSAIPEGRLVDPVKLSYSRRGLGLFMLICVIASAFFVLYLNQIDLNRDNKPADITRSEEQQANIPDYDTDKVYAMTRGAFIVVSNNDIPAFVKAAKAKDQNSIRSMVRDDKVLVFSDRTSIKVTGKPLDSGFVPVTVTEGKFSGSSGFAPYNMIEE